MNPDLNEDLFYDQMIVACLPGLLQAELAEGLTPLGMIRITSRADALARAAVARRRAYLQDEGGG